MKYKTLQTWWRCLPVYLLVCVMLPVQANEGISSFHARYDLIINDNRVGETSLRAEVDDNSIRMRMLIKPEGLYAIFTNRQSYTEVTMSRDSGDFRLNRVSISLDVEQDPSEVAVFDWRKSLLTAKRKGKKLEIPLTRDVYEYLSIHWLAAQLIRADAAHYDLMFYRNGKLMASSLVRTGEETIELEGGEFKTTVYEQRFKESSRVRKYYYDQQNPWLPVRIERTRKGKKKTVLQLKSLENSS